MKMMISQGRVVEGSPDEIAALVEIIDKGRTTGIKQHESEQEESVRKERSDKGKKHAHKGDVVCMNVTQKQAIENLSKYTDDPITIKEFCIAFGFQFRFYGSGNSRHGSFGGGVSLFLNGLQKRGVRFIMSSNGRHRRFITRDEQLKAIEMITFKDSK